MIHYRMTPMNINHPILSSVEDLELEMSEHLGFSVKYVMTSDLIVDDVPMNIFYLTDKPEDEKENYIATPTLNSLIYTISADVIETYDIGMIVDENDSWYYSSSYSDCVMIEGKTILGGRRELNGNGFCKFVVREGNIVENLATEYVDYYWPHHGNIE